jgi:hypothetical protein
MAKRPKSNNDNLTGYDYPCPLFSFKTKECAITLDSCRRKSDLQRSPDGNCRIRIDNYNQYLIDSGMVKKEGVEDYEEVIDVKAMKEDMEKIIKKFKMVDFVVGKVEEHEFV